MNRSSAILAASLLACSGSTLCAQVSSMSASGFLHSSVGGTSLEQLSDRRVRVTNIGSSGEDGVEVRFRTVFGAGSACDLDEVLSHSGTGSTAAIKHRHKGWDGLIYGTHRVSSGAVPGSCVCQCDLSYGGATTMLYRCLDSSGAVLATGTVPSSVTWEAQLPPGSVSTRVAIKTRGTGADKNRSSMKFTGGPGTVNLQITVTGLHSSSVSGVESVEFEPIGGTGDGRTMSSDWTGEGVVDLFVSAPSISSLNVPCPPWDCFGLHETHAITGLGGATVTEQCEKRKGTEECDDRSADRLVEVDNIGSSGQDGVSIDFGPVRNGEGLSVARNGNCCRGHVIIMKAFDDADAESGRMTLSSNAATGSDDLSMDVSTIPGAIGIRIHLRDEFDGVIATEEILGAVVGGVAIANPCPYGSWVYIPGCVGPWWKCYKWWCDSPLRVIMPSGAEVFANGVSIEPVMGGALLPRVRRLEVTTDFPNGLHVNDISPPQCVSDVDDGSGTGTPDGGTTIEDLIYFLQRFDAGC